MNPLMQSMAGVRDPMGRMSQVLEMMKTLRNGNPEYIAKKMMQNNPQFRQFVEANKGKTPEQVAREYGVDLNQLKSVM